MTCLHHHRDPEGRGEDDLQSSAVLRRDDPVVGHSGQNQQSHHAFQDWQLHTELYVDKWRLLPVKFSLCSAECNWVLMCVCFQVRSVTRGVWTGRVGLQDRNTARDVNTHFTWCFLSSIYIILYHLSSRLMLLWWAALHVTQRLSVSLQSPSCSVPSSAAAGVEVQNPSTAAMSTVLQAAPDLEPPTAWSVSPLRLC